MPEFWICRATHGLPVFVNMTGFWICVRMQSWKGSEHSRIPNMPGFCICKLTQSFEYAWIWLNDAWINCSVYGRVLNMPNQSFTGFWICSGYKYAEVWNLARLWIWKGYTGCRIYLNKPEYALIMPPYALICTAWKVGTTKLSLQTWVPQSCPCWLCKQYISGVGFSSVI